MVKGTKRTQSQIYRQDKSMTLFQQIGGPYAYLHVSIFHAHMYRFLIMYLTRTSFAVKELHAHENNSHADAYTRKDIFFFFFSEIKNLVPANDPKEKKERNIGTRASFLDHINSTTFYNLISI